MTLRIELFAWACWVNAVTSAGLAALTCFSRPLNKVKALWATTCLSIAVWSVGLGWMTMSTSEPSARLGNTLLYAGAILIPVLFIHTVAALVKKKSAFFLPLAYAAAIIFEILNFSGDFSGVGPMADFRFYTRPLWPYHFYTVYFYLIFMLVEVILWRESSRAGPAARRQLRLLFWGTALGCLGGQMTFYMVYGLNIFPYGNFFAWSYVMFVGYGMLRFQLMDFKTAFGRMTLAFGIYALMAAVALPLSWPVLRALRGLDPVLFPRVALLIVFLSVLLGSGPLVYAYLVRHAYWLRGHVTTGLTHELKSPLGSIQSAADIVMGQLDSRHFDRRKAVDYMKMIQGNAARLEVFVKDLLEIAKIQDGNVAMERGVINFSEMVRSAAEVVRPVCEQKGLALRLEYNGHVMKVNGDREKLYQVISNVLSNAVKFSHQGEIRVSVEKSGGELQCSVKDQGCGIPAKDMGRVFERFYHGNYSSKGAGLGLSIAKAWVEAHGGKIWAESAGEGHGTTVTFTVPV